MTRAKRVSQAEALATLAAALPADETTSEHIWGVAWLDELATILASCELRDPDEPETRDCFFEDGSHLEIFKSERSNKGARFKVIRS